VLRRKATRGKPLRQTRWQLCVNEKTNRHALCTIRCSVARAA
jgi:hypothetical protein